MTHRIIAFAGAAVFVLAVMVAPVRLEAQSPDEDWRTIETEHYRIHFTHPYEDWARYAASRLESVREIVGQEVGFVPEQTIDVVVMDPISRANGSAWPFLGYPRMVLWTSPPGPESVIGYYDDWVELLTIHEQAHLAHLLRPSRNPLRRLAGEWLGVGPITLAVPRWVSEGYATVIEGDLTGTGRPRSDIRAAILRKWAQEGRLPSYERMSSDSRSYLGMSMAYLVGSTFLEWLREREGPDSFRKVWARMTAKRKRSFDEAFRGVYGDSPSKLYARFRAELVHHVLELEERLEPVREGELWQDLSWQTGAPAVSSDGSKIAIVLRGRKKPSRLVVWETKENDEALKKWNEEVEKLREEDPEDVPSVLRKPLRRKPSHELVARDGADILTPRWMKDGSILFVRFEPDPDGFLHPDLFRWNPESGAVSRLTRGADLREPTPISGNGIVAVRRRWGKSSLVFYDIGTGSERSLIESSLTTILGWPRADRAGNRVALSRHLDGRWRLSVLDVNGGALRDLDLPPGATTVAYPEWSPDGRTIFASVGSGGLIDVWKFDPAGEAPAEPVTRSFGAALAPSIGDDGQLFYLELDADGLDLNVLAQPEETVAPAPDEILALAPIGRRDAGPPPRKPAIEEPGPSRPYRIGRMERRWLLGGGRTPSEETWELGIRFGDLVGRLDSIVIGAVSSGGSEGGSARVRWRGWPVEVEGHLFRYERTRGEGPVRLPAVDAGVEEDRRGGELIIGWDRVWRDGRLGLEGGALFDRVELSGPTSGTEADRRVGFATLELRKKFELDPWVLGGSMSTYAFAGELEGGSWDGWTATVGMLAGLEDHHLTAWYRRGGAGDGDRVSSFVVGGAPTSLTPSFDHILRVWSPGLVEGTLSGTEYEGWRIELETDLLPVVPFYEAHRAGADLQGGWTDLAGARVDLELDSFPLLKLPGATLSLGGAYVLDGPRADVTEWWITTRWKLD